MKKYSLYTNPQLMDAVAGLYGKQGEGVTSALDCFLELNRRMTAIKLPFSREELIAIIDAYNGTMMDRKFFVLDFFRVQMEDAEAYESTCTRHGCDVQTLIEKAGTLHYAELFFMLEQINRFWNVGNGVDLEGFLKKLLDKPMVLLR